MNEVEDLDDIKNHRIAELSPEWLAVIQSKGLVLELDQSTANAVKSGCVTDELRTRFAEVHEPSRVATEQISSINNVLVVFRLMMAVHGSLVWLEFLVELLFLDVFCRWSWSWSWTGGKLILWTLSWHSNML
ncbi:hypothetical protein E2P81_ATG12148 [Venturia nashicola]|nr:hypothetical protein E2P81_ATG12148 [Venturia nashicola]